MFKFQFFGGFSRQKKALFAAKEYAPEPIHKSVSEQFEKIVFSSDQNFEILASKFSSSYGLIRSCFYIARQLIFKSVYWYLFESLIAVSVVLILRRITELNLQISSVILYSSLYLLLLLVSASIRYFDMLRRAQVNRIVQAYLFTIVNQKISSVDQMTMLQFSSGELKTLVQSDIESLEDFVSNVSSNLVPPICYALVLLPAIIYIGGVPGFFAFLFSIISVPITFVLAKLIEYFQLKAQKKQDDLLSLVSEWIRNVRLIRYLNWQYWMLSSINNKMTLFARDFAKRHLVVCVTFGLGGLWTVSPFVGFLLAVYFFQIKTSTSILFACVWLLENFLRALNHVVDTATQFGIASASASRVFDLLSLPGRPVSFSESKLMSSFEGVSVELVELEDVSFDYRSKNTDSPNVIFSNLNLTINLKQKTAIIGTVASGKTTLLHLLVGEIPPKSGTIWIHFSNGQKLSLWDKSVYYYFRRLIAFSPSEAYLSSTSLKNNIDLSANRPIDEVLEATRLSLLSDDIKEFVSGIEEEVGEVGINLSGGQKQRINLARVFISKRQIYFLDDPLSAVDRGTERKLMQNILAQAKGLVLVSHRLDELQTCDRVIVLESGKIVNDASPQEVISRERSLL
jgi:ABC-type multidrug transport system fused ATPase/permease subunit